ncbi:cell division protein SepF [Hominifimenecus sp. rT4P-3]|uniref:cell division protein SepF n=1 Tax=Hominifimenecus sp. rT4P-3 TaxID=3242979 RepID=UPI003DA3F6F2
MANIIDKFLNSMKLNDDDYDEEDDFDLEDEFEEEELPSSRFNRKKKLAREEDDMDMPPVEREQRPLRVKRSSAANNVVPMRSRSNMEVCMVKPASIDDAREVCDILLSGRAVVINMEGVHVDLAQRIIDFTSGACYSMNGNLQKISNYIFIVTPSSIELSGDFQDVISGRESAATLSLDL